MTLPPGVRLGPYEIVAQIGAGGMGEVYRATDTNLGREVAIKVLPDAVANDPDRLARFDREARTLAVLNHPNIAHIYGLEHADRKTALVMELVEGPTLADRLARGPIPIEEALLIAKQLAEALEAAHEHGIIHRDLKPANVKVRPDGVVKVLDFGLAKAMEPAAAMSPGQSSPTITSPAMTQMGVILGTAAYMSPEQAKGLAIDTRCDIWAFGCVIYEMLAGRQAFTGATVVETLGAVLKSEPDWRALPPTTPPAVVSLLQRCLQKDRNRRIRDIADARFQIEEAPNERVSPIAPAALPRSSRERLLWVAVTLVLASALALSLGYGRRASDDVPEMRLEIGTPPGASLSSFALSPDGHALVYQATIEGTSQLWLRRLDSETPQPLTTTDDLARPFWSADSRSVGFFADGQLKRVDIEGGLVQTLAAAPLNIGGAWGPDGTILFTQSSIEPLYRIPAQSGKVTAVTAATVVKAPHRGHRFPCFLPDGRRFLFFAFGPPESQGIYAGSLDSMDVKRVLDAESAPVFLPPDFLMFARQGAVFAQRLNMESLQPTGDPLLLARKVATPTGNIASVALSAATTGTVAYRAHAGERQLRWVDREGRQVGLLGGPDPDQPDTVRLSADGRTVALTRMVSGNRDVWVLETARDAGQKFTSRTHEYSPVWSSDGDRIAFGSTRKGVVNLYERSLSVGGNETVLFESPESKNLYDWSSDRQWILFATQSPNTARDLWALPMKGENGEKRPIVVAHTMFEEREARFSPDAKWIAYQSNESGRFEIYVQPFPGPGIKSQISTGGGTFPKWDRDGRLFFLNQANRVTEVRVARNRSRAEAGTTVALFPLSPGASFETADGQRFLINEIVKDPSPITILLNWRPK